MAGVPSALAEGLSDRYVLERELGRGGMATVYLARDVRHERYVALKVLHPELAVTLGPERFEREIKVCAKLQHPHILTVHDSGETVGQLWFTMPYVEGESLRAVLTREKQLAVDVAVRITTEAARALEYAHKHGVIHRDVKPENLLITPDGSTLVADFGIARALTPGTESLTQTGMSVGTPAYMSPEQAAGDKNLGCRSDVYSLATVLYEMLAGEPPYTGPSAQAIVAKRFSDQLPRVRRLRPGVPKELDEAVLKALALVPADRFATMAQFAESVTAPPALNNTQEHATRSAFVPPAVGHRVSSKWRAVIGAFAIVLAASIALLVQGRADDSAELSGASPRGLAVLPFENLGDSADAYFADGVTDAVRGKLSGLPGLQVTARSSSSQYRKTLKTPQQIGRELGVQYLLTATVRWEKVGGQASRVQVTPELVQAATASTKWQQPFDAALTGVFQVQADIAGRVAEALDLAMGDSARQQLVDKPTQNLAAYDAYLRGEELYQSGYEPRTLRRAASYYAQAVALDSGFAQAWAQLSRAYSGLSIVTTPTPGQAEQARRAAERALALSPGQPEGHLAMCNYYWGVVKDNVSALKECERGLKLAPNDVDLLTMSALAEKWLGRWEAALTHLQQAQRLEPRSVGAASGLAEVLFWQRRYTEARVTIERALALAPRDLGVVQIKSTIALAEGDLEGARAVINAVPKDVDRRVLVAFLATYWDLFWVLDDAQQMLLLGLSPSAFDDDRGMWGLVLAQTYWLRGDHTKARVYADSARIAFEPQIRAAPRDEQRHVLHGLALAYLGQKTEAIREGRRAVAILPITKDAFGGAYMQHQLSRIYMLVGETDKALDQLEPLLRRPYYLSAGWLRIDPTFDPLRKHPRFYRLLEGKTVN
jgi:eukaryotic-like serine/threonine-protein kinase